MKLNPKIMGRWWQPIYLGLMTSVIVGAFQHWAYDDPFITYRYADNLYRGLGFVYNLPLTGDERVLSTTTPLFAVLLALLRNVSPNLPGIAKLIGGFSLALGGLCLWALARTWDAPWVGRAGLVLYPTFPLVLSTLGSETPLYLAFCLGAFTFYARARYSLTALCLALAVLTRADGILVALILGSHYLFRIRRPLPWPALLLGIALMLPWFGFAWVYFGSPVPATLTAKQQQGSMAISQRFGPGLLSMIRDYAPHWHYGVEGFLAGLGVIGVIRRLRRWGLILLWAVLYFLAYAVLGVSRYFWYYAPLVPGFLVASGLGIEGLVRAIRAYRGQAGLGLGMVMLTALGVAQTRDLFQLSQQPDNRLPIYRAAGEWLEAYTPSDTRVGTLEVGIIGYYAHRPMVDFAGLIQPEVAQQLTGAATYETAAHWAIRRYQPEYLVLNPAWFPGLMSGVVLPACAPRQTLVGETYGYPGELIIYECDWDKASLDQ